VSAGGPPPAAGAERHLVTGASGFIGGRLALRLHAEGRRVRALVRASSDRRALEQAGVEIAVGDLRDLGSLARACDGIDTVFHCAALVSDWASVKEIRTANVHGTRNLLASAGGAGVRRVVHVSTTDVYGHPGTPVDEDCRGSESFANWYAETKRGAEALALRAHSAGQVEVAIVRPATVYGPGSREVIGEIARALRNGQMLLIDGGRPLAGLCYVENLLDAMLLAATAAAAAGQAYNVSDDLDVTWRRFTDDLAAGLGVRPARWSLPYPLALALGAAMEHGYRGLRRATGLTLPPLLSRQAVQVLGRSQDFSTRRLRQQLGWEPRVGYEQGLELTLAWLRGDSADAGSR
jgi:nucleoside-diphosphate-sugar epimerase